MPLPVLEARQDFTKVYPSNELLASAEEVSERQVKLKIPFHELEAFLADRQEGCRWKKGYLNVQGGSKHMRPELESRLRLECDRSRSYQDKKKKDLSPSKRRDTAPSKLVKCHASISIEKLFGNNETLLVTWTYQHNGHDPLSTASWARSSLPQDARDWIAMRVKEGRDWNSARTILRADAQEISQITDATQVFPQAMRIKRMDYYNETRKQVVSASHLDKDFFTSVDMHFAKIVDNGGWSFVNRKVLDVGVVGHYSWAIGFASQWQRAKLAEYGQDIVCLDSTHNTCTAMGGKKVYLYTLLIRNAITGQGCPVAFLLTNSSTSLPLSAWLCALKNDLNFTPQYVMIDCSETEALAINTAFSRVRVLYCYYHLLTALVKRAKLVLKAPDNSGEGIITSSQPNEHAISIKNTARLAQEQRTQASVLLRARAKDDFCSLLNCASKQEFETLWKTYQSDWSAFPAWIKYVDTQWMHNKDRWGGPWRQTPHCGINTNNYIERWHADLKMKYLGTLRQQRADHLIRILYTECLPDYADREKKCELSLLHRRLCKDEEKSKQRAYALAPDEAQTMVKDLLTENNKAVQSFTNDKRWYHLKTEGTKENFWFLSCGCINFEKTGLPCKHMWLAFRMSGVLPYRTAHPEISISLSPSSSQTLSPSSSGTLSSATLASPSEETQASSSSESGNGFITAEAVAATKRASLAVLCARTSRLSLLCNQLAQPDNQKLVQLSREALFGYEDALTNIIRGMDDIVLGRSSSATQR